MPRTKKSDAEKRKGMRFSLVMITPAKARSVLERNEANRSLATSRWKHYARIMDEGKWRGDLDTRPIAVDIDGNLLDGQHRLRALVEHGKPLRMWVAYGCLPESRRYIDKGGARTIANTLQMEYGVPWATRSAAIAKLLNMFDTGKLMRLTEDDVLFYIAKYRPAYDWFYEVEKRALLNGAPLFACLMWTYKKHPEEIVAFYHQVRTGEGLTAHSPALKLRERMLVGGRTGSQQATLSNCLYVFGALRNHLDGRKLRSLRPNKEAAMYFRRLMRRPAKADAWIDVAWESYQRYGKSIPRPNAR